MWRRGETDGESQGKRSRFENRVVDEESRSRGGRRGGLAVRVSLMKHSWRCEPTALSWQASPHQPVDIIIQPSRAQAHTHTPDLLHCAAAPPAHVCDLWFKGTHMKCLFMLLQSGIHTHPSHTHIAFYTASCYVLWLLARLLLDQSHTSSNWMILVPFWACVRRHVCVCVLVHRHACYTLSLALCRKREMFAIILVARCAALPSAWSSFQTATLSVLSSVKLSWKHERECRFLIRQPHSAHTHIFSLHTLFIMLWQMSWQWSGSQSTSVTVKQKLE